MTKSAKCPEKTVYFYKLLTKADILKYYSFDLFSRNKKN